MNTSNVLNCVVAAAWFAGNAASELSAAEMTFTSRFPLDACHFSVFGGAPYFILNPGHQLTLIGEEDGEEIVLIITALDETKEITLPSNGVTRKIITRVVEERETADGELVEVSRNWFARCVETGDIYYFGEAVDNYEDGEIVSHDSSWEAGVGGAAPGIIMPGTFLLGSRYYQEVAPGVALDQAENEAEGLTEETPAGFFSGCIRVREYNPLEPSAAPGAKTYAPGVGLVNSDGQLELTEFRLGEVESLPSGCTFVAYSHHPLFPLSPGRRSVLQGREDGEQVELTITVLEETQEVQLGSGANARIIPVRVVEERELVDGELNEIVRNLFAQCLETGDVYYFGEEVAAYEDGQVVSREGSWRAGVDGAVPGLIMPGIFAVGAQYIQQKVPGIALDSAFNAQAGFSATVPAGTFSGCVRVTERNDLVPLEVGRNKTYAPGVGVINDDNVLTLTSYTVPGGSGGTPSVSVANAVSLAWPLTERVWTVERSTGLTTWTRLITRPYAEDGYWHITVAQDSKTAYFRLVDP